PPGPSMLEPGHPAHLIYGTVFGAGLTAGWAFWRLTRGGRRSFVHALTWIVTLGALGGGAYFGEEVTRAVDTVHTQLVPSFAVSHYDGEVELRRAWDGHYRADAMVNGRELRLLVDTGASMVLIPYEQADEIGFDVAKLNYSMPVTTANGRSSVAPVRLDSIQIGQIRVENINAAVARPGVLQDGLLGMSFLDQLSETSFQGDKLYLRQRFPVRDGRFQIAPEVGE
ncbi:MAG: TIGR02281 family clan AA aspartic protease, partial [Pseudomonadota bacterium]